MAQDESPTTLLRLSDTQLRLADPAEDVRGRKVLNKDGEAIGEVNELIVDGREGHVRFLEVSSGDLLGLGRLRSLIPVGAITRISGEAVHVKQTRQRIGEAPAYDPDLIDEREGDEGYYGHLYRHYGLPPHWEWGYAYPRVSSPS
jgi:sporulation protein YlmC with PRC-barrel domain